MILGAGWASILAGCGAEGEEEVISVVERQQTVMPFEEYRDRALRIVDGRRLYQVEWDLYYQSEEDLHAHYVARVEGEVNKSTAIVDQATGNHVTFNGSAALEIRYCVSTTFGTKYSQAVTDAAAASRAWEEVANVRFVYTPSRDGSCAQADSGIDIAVIPTSSATQSACGTPPSLPPATLPIWCPYPLGTLAMDYGSWRWGWLSSFPNLQTVGILRHEFGHILGFRHEHVRGGSGCESPVGCSGTACLGADYLTEYDINSVMHYPQCSGVASTSWPLSPLDGIGARILYGMPASWYVPILTQI